MLTIYWNHQPVSLVSIDISSNWAEHSSAKHQEQAMPERHAWHSGRPPWIGGQRRAAGRTESMESVRMEPSDFLTMEPALKACETMWDHVKLGDLVVGTVEPASEWNISAERAGKICGDEFSCLKWPQKRASFDVASAPAWGSWAIDSYS